MGGCTLDDLLDLETLGDPQCSPHRSRVAVVVTRRDPDRQQAATSAGSRWSPSTAASGHG